MQKQLAQNKTHIARYNCKVKTDIAEAKTLARKDAKEIMKEQLDFVEELYDNTLNDLD